MFELEPGAIGRLEPDQFEPFPPRSSFLALLGQAREQLVGHDPALTGAASTAGNDPTVAIDARYIATIAGAENHVDAEIGTAPTSPAPTLVADGDNIDRIRQSVLRYLPGPDGPILMTLDPPPAPPDLENPFPTPPPRGGDDGDTAT